MDGDWYGIDAACGEMGGEGWRFVRAGEMLWGFVRIIARRRARGNCAPSVIRGKLQVWSKIWGGGRRRRDVNPCGDRSKNFLQSADF